jgi:hypothetical protein
MIKDNLITPRTILTKRDKDSISQWVDKEMGLTREVEKVAVIRQEEVVQDLTTILIQTTNIRISIMDLRIIIVAQTIIKKVLPTTEDFRVHQDNKEVKISYLLSTSVIQIFS